MAFPVSCAVMELLFSEELGLVLEVSQTDLEAVCQRYRDGGLRCHRIGRTCGFGPEATVRHLQTMPRPSFFHADWFSSPPSAPRSGSGWMDRRFCPSRCPTSGPFGRQQASNWSASKPTSNVWSRRRKGFPRGRNLTLIWPLTPPKFPAYDSSVRSILYYI